MKEWFTLPELSALALPDLPKSRQALDARAEREAWRHIDGKARRADRKGGGWEYHFSILPSAAQTKLLMVHSAPANDDRNLMSERRAALWARFEGLSKGHKMVAADRLDAVIQTYDLELHGYTAVSAAAVTARKFEVSTRTIFNWQEICQQHAREDWLAALAPNSGRSGREMSECHPEAWETLKSDYLRAEKPGFSACYRRVVEAAKQHKWSPVPSERALRRRLEDEVSAAVITLARSGKDKAKALYPAQRRTRDHLHAMSAVNMDGHKLDVFVRMPDDSIIRLFLIALQDLYSGKFVAWRLSDSENKETTRLVIGDMVERFGIPDRITLDNGRAFASKWITGGAQTRYRFKVRDEDPRGLLVTLGVELQFTKPYSGQSKPIERAFRDLTDNIARHPVCAGAYTGNRPEAKPENYASHAVPFETFRIHVDRQMAEHNARPGRKGGNCKGRSFDQTFADSMADASTIVRQPTFAQRSLWLLASEGIRARKGNGEIHLHGNRYWAAALTGYAGKSVIIRFDPDHLTRDLKVYDLDNQLICDAPCISDTGFHDAEAARKHEQARNAYQKALTAERRAHAALSAEQLADIYAKGQPAAPEMPTAIKPKITRIATGSAAQAAAMDDEDFTSSFSRALARVSGGADVIQFPGQTGDEPKSSAYGSRKKKGGK